MKSLFRRHSSEKNIQLFSIFVNAVVVVLTFGFGYLCQEIVANKAVASNSNIEYSHTMAEISEDVDKLNRIILPLIYRAEEFPTGTPSIHNNAYSYETNGQIDTIKNQHLLSYVKYCDELTDQLESAHSLARKTTRLMSHTLPDTTQVKLESTMLSLGLICVYSEVRNIRNLDFVNFKERVEYLNGKYISSIQHFFPKDVVDELYRQYKDFDDQTKLPYLTNINTVENITMGELEWASYISNILPDIVFLTKSLSDFLAGHNRVDHSINEPKITVSHLALGIIGLFIFILFAYLMIPIPDVEDDTIIKLTRQNSTLVKENEKLQRRLNSEKQKNETSTARIAILEREVETLTDNKSIESILSRLDVLERKLGNSIEPN